MNNYQQFMSKYNTRIILFVVWCGVVWCGVVWRACQNVVIWFSTGSFLNLIIRPIDSMMYAFKNKHR